MNTNLIFLLKYYVKSTFTTGTVWDKVLFCVVFFNSGPISNTSKVFESLSYLFGPEIQDFWQKGINRNLVMFGFGG